MVKACIEPRFGSLEDQVARMCAALNETGAPVTPAASTPAPPPSPPTPSPTSTSAGSKSVKEQLIDCATGVDKSAGDKLKAMTSRTIEERRAKFEELIKCEEEVMSKD